MDDKINNGQEQKNKCPGDCMKCTASQHLYCAAQIGYNTMTALSELSVRVAEMQVHVSQLALVVAEMQAEKEAAKEAAVLVEAPTSGVKKTKGKAKEEN